MAALDRRFFRDASVSAWAQASDWDQVGADVASPMTLCRDCNTLTAGFEHPVAAAPETDTFSNRTRSNWSGTPSDPVARPRRSGPRNVATGTGHRHGSHRWTRARRLRAAVRQMASASLRAMCPPRAWSSTSSAPPDPMPNTKQSGGGGSQRHRNLDSPRHRRRGMAAGPWLDAGAATVVLQPSAAVDIHSFLRFVGTEVQPHFSI